MMTMMKNAHYYMYISLKYSPLITITGDVQRWILAGGTWQSYFTPFSCDVALMTCLYLTVEFEEPRLTSWDVSESVSGKHCMTGFHQLPAYWTSQTIWNTSDSTMLWSADEMFHRQFRKPNAQNEN